MVKTAKLIGRIKGFEIAMSGHNNHEITHLQDVDDSLILCDAKMEQMRILRMTQLLFEGTSGLHINWRKSHLSLN